MFNSDIDRVREGREDLLPVFVGIVVNLCGNSVTAFLACRLDFFRKLIERSVEEVYDDAVRWKVILLADRSFLIGNVRATEERDQPISGYRLQYAFGAFAFGERLESSDFASGFFGAAIVARRESNVSQDLCYDAEVVHVKRIDDATEEIFGSENDVGVEIDGAFLNGADFGLREFLSQVSGDAGSAD